MSEAPRAGDEFGVSVSLHNDHALIGSWLSDHTDVPTGQFNNGAAYLFAHADDGWQSRTMLMPDGPLSGMTGDSFGREVDLYGDRALVASPYDCDPDPSPSDFPCGSVYIFEKDGDDWPQAAKLSAPRSDAWGFGKSIAIGSEWAVVTSTPDVQSVAPGYAFVYRRDEESGWVHDATLQPSDNSRDYGFGTAVAVDGDRIVVGTRCDFDQREASSCSSGAAYVFDYSDGMWNQADKLTVPGSYFFGRSVDVEDDRVVVGAHFEYLGLGLSSAGAAYVFDLSDQSWVNTAKLTAPDAGYQEEFGYSVSLSGDQVLVGARFDTHDDKTKAGSAYVFRFTENQWSPVDKLVASDADTGDFFGFDVSLDKDRALVGAWYDDLGELHRAGSAYVFTVPEPNSVLLVFAWAGLLAATMRKSRRL